MNPSLRSQLRDTLRARCDSEGWRALVAQHGTPLLVLDPYRVVEQCRLLASQLRGFRLHYAVKTSSHPAVLRAVAAAGCGFDVATRGRGRSRWRTGPSHRPLYQHQPDQEARPTSTTPTSRAFARSSSTIRSRRRSSRGCPPTSRCWCGSRSAIRRRSRICRRSSASIPPTPNSSSSTCWRPGFASAASAFTSAARARPPSRTGTPCAAPSTSSATSAKHSACRTRIIDIGGGFPVTYREPMPTIDTIAAVVDEVLGDRRDEFTLAGRAGPLPRRRQHDVVDQRGRQRRARRPRVALPRRRASTAATRM